MYSQFGNQLHDALAMLLGHELVHLYVNHQWIVRFGKPQRFAPLSHGAVVLAEKQADYLGAFYAYLAGYQPYPIAEKLINAIYQHYQLPDQLEGYPSRRERIYNILEGFAEAQELIHAFRAGLALIATENYLHAENAFLYLINKSKEFGIHAPKEVYNNAAAALLHYILKHTDKDEMPYFLPIESEVHLRRMNQYRSQRTNFDLEKYIQRCKNYLEEALSIDHHYQPALLNWMAVHLLSKSPNPEAVIGKYKESPYEFRRLPACMTMTAIAYDMMEKKADAKFLFHEAEKSGVWYAKANLEIFQNKSSIFSYILEYYNFIRHHYNSEENNSLSSYIPPVPAIPHGELVARNISDAPYFTRIKYRAHTEADKYPLIIQANQQKIYLWKAPDHLEINLNNLSHDLDKFRFLSERCLYFPSKHLLVEIIETKANPQKQIAYYLKVEN